mmetsp:Transcript_100943/g.268345  ORF Transcript_100943/g.268345 Transcript_100943/m.268345 type:complete len:229 (-) Transcript_100943:460-1146(-)
MLPGLRGRLPSAQGPRGGKFHRQGHSWQPDPVPAGGPQRPSCSPGRVRCLRRPSLRPGHRGRQELPRTGKAGRGQAARAPPLCGRSLRGAPEEVRGRRAEPGRRRRDQGLPRRRAAAEHGSEPLQAVRQPPALAAAVAAPPSEAALHRRRHLRGRASPAPLGPGAVPVGICGERLHLVHGRQRHPVPPQLAQLLARGCKGGEQVLLRPGRHQLGSDAPEHGQVAEAEH